MEEMGQNLTKWAGQATENQKTLQRPVPTTTSQIQVLVSMIKLCSELRECWTAGREMTYSVFQISDAWCSDVVKVNGQCQRCQPFFFSIFAVQLLPDTNLKNILKNYFLDACPDICTCLCIQILLSFTFFPALL